MRLLPKHRAERIRAPWISAVEDHFRSRLIGLCFMKFGICDFSGTINATGGLIVIDDHLFRVLNRWSS